MHVSGFPNATMDFELLNPQFMYKCPNGHVYPPTQHGTCPECGEAINGSHRLEILSSHNVMSDLKILQEEITQMKNRIKADFDKLKDDIQAEFNEKKDEIEYDFEDLKDEIQTEIDEIKDEAQADFDDRLQTMRSEMNAEWEAKFKERLTTMQTEIRAEIQANFDEHLKTLRTDMKTSMLTEFDESSKDKHAEIEAKIRAETNREIENVQNIFSNQISALRKENSELKKCLNSIKSLTDDFNNGKNFDSSDRDEQ